MSWEHYKLNDICKSISDGDHQPPPKAENGIPFVTIANITNANKFDFSNTMFVPQEYYDKLDDKRRAHVGDILYSVVGSFGIPVYMSEEQKFVFQRHIAILRPDETKVVPQFLYYTMLSRDFYMKADAVALGAAQRTVSLTSLRGMDVTVPDLEMQRKIVDILKPYDELIENNQKQIKLLEEAAQRLYKEWFVDLRFPGYEETEIVDGIPVGWQELNIDQQYEIKYGKTLPTSKITDRGKYPVYGASKVIGYYGEKNVSKRTVLITSRGNAGTVYRTHHNDAFVTNNSFIVAPKFEELHIPFIYYQMQELNFKAITTGSCQPQLTNNSISMKKTILPAERVLKIFNNYTDDYYERIEKLLNEISLLSEARDRLLPKLMSGEIEV